MGNLLVCGRTLVLFGVIVGSSVPAQATTTAVGRTAGTFAVTQTGAANYTIPLWVPPGPAGLQPELALQYNSAITNGVMGPGWQITGQSEITRCNATYAQDGAPGTVSLTTADRFCLDGKRLRSFGGTTYGADGAQYQTEIADFSLVISHGTAGNGPAWFEVHRKDGMILQYGNTSDSKVIAAGATVVSWELNQVTDRIGNYRTYSYSTTTGGIALASIQYTATPGNSQSAQYSVVFTNVARPTTDRPTKYVSSTPLVQTYQLSTITVNSAAQPVRTYSLTYTPSPTTQRSTLTSVQECSPTQCYPSTNIAYQGGTPGLPGLTTSISGTTPAGASPYGTGLNSYATVDVNGDGRADLVFATQTSTTSSSHWYVAFGTPTGLSAPVDTGLITSYQTDQVLFDDFVGEGQVSLLATQIPVVNGGTATGNWTLVRWNGTAFVKTVTNIAVDPNMAIQSYPRALGAIASADTDGDGLPDLVSLHVDGTVWIQRNTSTGGVLSFAGTRTNAFGLGSAHYVVGDVIILGNNAFPNAPAKHLDMRGEGRDDIVATYSVPGTTYYEVLLPAATAFTAGLTVSGPWSQPQQTFIPMHFNEDACTDVLLTGSVYVSGCNGAAPLSIAVAGGVSAMDWNGDGRDDVIAVNGGSFSVYESVGNGFASPIQTTLGTSNTYGNVLLLPADLDGDGLHDLIGLIPTASQSNANIFYGLHGNAGTKPDLATSFTDGFGVAYTPTYFPITNPTYYLKGSGATYPEADWQAPMAVVGYFGATDGLGGAYTTTMYYDQARINLQGRGFEGFYLTRSQDSRSLIYDFRYYNQLFPQTGTLSRDLLQQSSSVPIRNTVNTWSSAALDSTAYDQRYFPYIAQSVESDYEVATNSFNGVLITQKTTTNTYGGPNGFAYGNPTVIDTQVVDEDSTSPSYGNSYEHKWTITPSEVGGAAATGWCIHLPTSVQETRAQSSPAGGTTRTTGYTVSSDGTCRVTAQTVEPGNSTLQIATVYGFDACGNINSTAVTGQTPAGTPMPTRTSKANFSYATTRCQAPEQTTDALGQNSTASFDYNLGVQVWATDPNGLSTSWTYDDLGRKTLEGHPDLTRTQWLLAACTSANSYCGDSSQALRYNVSQVELDATPGHLQYRYRNQYFDQFDRLRYDEPQQTNGALATTAYTYDNLGRLATTSNPYGNGFAQALTTNTYDLLNRKTSTYRPISSTNATLEYTYYTYQGRTQTTKDPKGNLKKYQYDVLGRLANLVDPDGTSTTRYTYDLFDNVASVTDPLTFALTRSYDLRGHLLSQSDPDRGSWIYQTDSLGEQINVRDPLTASPAWLQTYTYDALGRILTRIEREGTSTWIWGQLSDNTTTAKYVGRLKSLSGFNDIEAYTYDGAGRLATHSMTWGGTTYTLGYSYNTIGRTDVIQYPLAPGQTYPFAVKHGYAYGTLSSLRAYTNGVAGTVFWQLTPGTTNVDGWGHVVDETLGTTSAVRVQSAYDGVTSWMNTRQAGSGDLSANLQNATYQFDLNGNLSLRADLNQSGTCTVGAASGKLCETFVHDNLDRLQSSQLNGVTNLSMTIDPTGRVTAMNDTALGASYTYTFDPTHKHAVASETYSGSAHTYGYDGDGQMVNRNGVTLTWASYGLPTSLSQTTFSYGPDRQRKQQTASYSNDGTSGTESTIYVDPLFELETTPAQMHFKHYLPTPAGASRVIYDIQSASGPKTTYITPDYLGSGAVMLTSAGVSELNTSFGAFGYRRNSAWGSALSSNASDYTTIAATTRRGYTEANHEFLDDVQMIHMNGRVYKWDSLEFLSPDRVSVRLGESQTANPYSYVMNRPLSRIDPTGMDPLRDSRGSGVRKVTQFDSAALLATRASLLLRPRTVIHAWQYVINPDRPGDTGFVFQWTPMGDNVLRNYNDVPWNSLTGWDEFRTTVEIPLSQAVQDGVKNSATGRTVDIRRGASTIPIPPLSAEAISSLRAEDSTIANGLGATTKSNDVADAPPVPAPPAPEPMSVVWPDGTQTTIGGDTGGLPPDGGTDKQE